MRDPSAAAEPCEQVDQAAAGPKLALLAALHRKGWGPEYDEWKTEKQLGCPALLAEWVREGLAKGNIPRPGDVDLVCGGPPCQGVSGRDRTP